MTKQHKIDEEQKERFSRYIRFAEENKWLLLKSQFGDEYYQNNAIYLTPAGEIVSITLLISVNDIIVQKLDTCARREQETKMKKMVGLFLVLIVVLALSACISQATSGHINHQATDEIIYYPLSGDYQEVYLFSYYGIMSYVPAGTSSFVIKDAKVGNVEVYNIVYNSDDTLSCDWEKVK